MSVWLIQSRDPLIFRDGKPFNATPGARAQTLPFPYPSTLVGGVRTRAGRDASGKFDSQKIDYLLQRSIRGPLLVALDENGGLVEWFSPAPADSLIVEVDDKSQGQRYWVRPVVLPTGAATNLEPGLLVSVNPVVKQKPHTKAPRFWNWETMQSWLEYPANDATPVNLSGIGVAGLTPESRVHVCIDVETGTASEGLLFQTSGLEFSAILQDREATEYKKPKALSELRQYALAVETDADLGPGVDFLGGERRLVHWIHSDETLPACPGAIRKAIASQKHCRLLLATPAIFTQGYLPEWICQNTPGLKVAIVAAAVPRYQAVSGWDAKKRTQKASRRLAPAGSVYFLSLEGDTQAIERFIDDVWIKSVSDADQDRRDGFGLALLGAWDGKIGPLEVKE
jgi:CRISPR-associated protein Cmr3